MLTCLTEGLLDFYLTANNETRKNVTGLIKEAISSSVRVADNNLVIGILGTAVTLHGANVSLEKQKGKRVEKETCTKPQCLSRVMTELGTADPRQAPLHHMLPSLKLSHQPAGQLSGVLCLIICIVYISC